MGLPKKSVNIRLPDPMVTSLERLVEHLPGLSRSQILRGLLLDQFRKPIDAQARNVLKALTKPSEHSAPSDSSRISGDKDNS